MEGGEAVVVFGGCHGNGMMMMRYGWKSAVCKGSGDGGGDYGAAAGVGDQRERWRRGDEGGVEMMVWPRWRRVTCDNIKKGCPIFLAQVTKKESEDKSEEN
ncbi:hypothetical protein Tco_0897269 [Tanacetum coccineum]